MDFNEAHKPDFGAGNETEFFTQGYPAPVETPDLYPSKSAIKDAYSSDADTRLQ
ncbi:hypothetical protein D3C84_992170 [compost metagenome]